MQSGSINQGAPKNVAPKRGSAETAASNAEKVKAEQAAAADTESTPVAQTPEDTLPLGFVVDANSKVLEQDESGNYVRTLAFVNTADRARLEKEGAVFPEMKNALLGDGVGPNGSIEVVANYDTGNPETKNIHRPLEVNAQQQEIDPNTGAPRYESMKPVLLGPGEGVLGAGFKSIPEDYDVKAPVSPEGAKKLKTIKATRNIMNGLPGALNLIAASSLVRGGSSVLGGYAPVVSVAALAGVGFGWNQYSNTSEDLTTQMGQLDVARMKSKTDVVALDTPDGKKKLVSGKAEQRRLESKVLDARLKLGSSGLLALAGGSTIVAALARGGAEGLAGLAVAGAATPWLAGGALLLGQGGQIFDSLASLKELSKEKSELEQMQAQGKTHVDRVYENVDKRTKSGIAIGDKPVSVPIDERLKEITKEQSSARFMATIGLGGAASGLNFMSGLGAAAGIGTMAFAGVAMTPAALVAGGQSLVELNKLSKERKELEQLKADGQTMVEREMLNDLGSPNAPDLQFQKERVPISTLLAENQKARNLAKMKLTAAGSFAGGIALGVGAGFGLAAAAPAVLVPLAVGAILYPEKVKEFGQKIQDFIDGKFGESGKIDKATRKETSALYDTLAQNLDQSWAPLKEEHPDLFEERPNYLERIANNAHGVAGTALSPITAVRAQPGGYLFELRQTAADYANASSPMERTEILERMNKLFSVAPPEAESALGVFQQEMIKMKQGADAKWLVRDIELELKTPTTDKVLADDRVAARLKDLDFPLEDMKEQYKESLFIRHDQDKLDKLMEDSQKGDREASRKLARAEVFAAAQHLAAKEKQLGPELFARYIDALQRPEDTENLELLTKEVSYRQQVSVTENDINQTVGALRTLDTPLALAPESAAPYQAKLAAAMTELQSADPEAAAKLAETNAKITDGANFAGMTAQEALAARTGLNAQYQAARRALRGKSPDALKAWEEASDKLRSLPKEQPVSPTKAVQLQGPEARMTTAIRGLTSAEPELTQKFTEAFYKLNDVSQYQGMDVAEVQQARLQAQMDFDKVRGKLQSKAPDLVALWEGARKEAETAHFERQMDYGLRDKVLASAPVLEAAKELGISSEDVSALYMGLMRSQILADPRALQDQLADGKKIDEKKSQMLQVIDQSLLRTVAEETQGGADFQETAPTPVSPADDPNLQAWLQQRPDVVAALTSDGFKKIAEDMKMPVEDVTTAYLTMAQADLNPILGAEFNGRLQAGDMQTVNTFKVGQAALAYIQDFIKPDPQQVQMAVDQAMSGVAVQTVLNDPHFQAQAESLGVDSGQVMRLYLGAEFGKDPSAIAGLEQRAQKGDTAAANQLSFLQQAVPALHQVNQQLQAGVVPTPPEDAQAA